MNFEKERKYREQAEMLANRVLKKYKHLNKSFKKKGIEVFRLYDWDIPEIRAVIDWYGGHLVVAEYTRKQTVEGWLQIMGEAVADKLGVPEENVHYKERRMGNLDGKRYERIDYTNKKIVVSERDFKFFVNPSDYIDTGLFSDHRNTRQMIRELADGKNFLNLYCYTGTFSCYAAKGGAKTTTSVDRSETAIRWLKDNMKLNGIPEEGNRLVAQPVLEFLKNAKNENMTYDLAVVDPPSFSTSRDSVDRFDIATDYSQLLDKVAEIMSENSIIFFSTNHQDFEFDAERFNFNEVKEITAMTIPVDYVSKKKNMHRCWKIRV